MAVQQSLSHREVPPSLVLLMVTRSHPLSFGVEKG